MIGNFTWAMVGLLFCMASYMLGTKHGIDVTKIKPLITECEKDLPRNQTCILMAVPEEVEK